MNLFFGATTPSASNEVARDGVAAFCARHYGSRPTFESTAAVPLLGAVRTPGSRTLGRAERDGCVLLFNGSFFGPFPGTSDERAPGDPDTTAAVLLRRYLEAGCAFLDGLLGYYSLAIADSRSGTLHLAADPYGQRAPVYQSQERGVVFSSSVAAAVNLLDKPTLDRSWEDFFLIYGFYPHGRTPFSGLTAVPAGQVLSWTATSRSERPIAPYRAAEPPELEPGAPLARAVDVLHESFMSALEQQCNADSDVGVLLGGFDSALVAAGLRRLGKTVTTWSFSYEQEEYNQPHVEDLAAFLGIEHHWVKLTRDDLERGLDRFPYVFNQPTNWPNYVIQTAILAEKMALSGVAAIYSGDGCDTAFLGYPGTWKRARVLERVPSIPDGAARLLTRLLARPSIERRLGHPYRLILNLVRTSSWPRHVRGFLSFRLLDELSLAQIRSGPAPEQACDVRYAAAQLAAPFANLPSLRLAYQGKALISPNKNKMNGSSDVSGLPIVSPYMHPAFKQLAQSLPEELCRPNTRTASRITGKYALMKMAEEKGLLPNEVIYQRKVAAVDAPVDQWYAGPMRAFMRRKIADLPFTADASYVESLLEPHIAEQMFQKYLLTDRIIKQAPSLLATYASFCGLLNEIPEGAQRRAEAPGSRAP